MDDGRLDELVAKAPAEYQPEWIAEVIRAFAGSRGITDEADLFIKRGVHCHLIDLTRKLDIRRETVSPVALRLGVHRKTVARLHRRLFMSRFRANDLTVRTIRGKAA